MVSDRELNALLQTRRTIFCRVLRLVATNIAIPSEMKMDCAEVMGMVVLTMEQNR